MDSFSIKIEPDDENQNVVEQHKRREIVDTNTNDMSLEMKIEDENDYFVYSHFQSDSSFEVKIEIDELTGSKIICHETSLENRNESLLNIANLIVENEEKSRCERVDINKRNIADQNYKCEKCGKSFRRRDYLKDHIRIHSGEKPFKCQECSKFFTQRSHLFNHLRIHSGINPYKCVECDKSISQHNSLRHHLYTHNRIKPFECKECGKCFVYNYLLTSHRRIHTGEQNFRCQECGKCFTQQGHLKTHLKTHTKMQKLFNILHSNTMA